MNPEHRSAMTYLKAAALSIIKEKQLTFKSQAELNTWFFANTKDIARRASELQAELFEKIERNKDAVIGTLSTQIYFNIHRRNLSQQETDALNKILSEEPT